MDSDFVGRPLGDAGRRVAEQTELRRTYGYLFTAERERLTEKVESLTAENRDLREQVRSLSLDVTRLEYELSKKRSRFKPLNRVVFHVTVTVDGRAQDLAATLWATRNPATDVSMKVPAVTVVSDTELKMVIDYTVKGGNPHDIWRPAGNDRPGMLNRVASSLDIVIIDVACEEQSREVVESDEFAA